MARIQLTSAKVRHAYCSQLTERQQRAFDELTELLEHQRDDLLWHYQVGACIQQLAPKQAAVQGWLKHLAQALGVSEAMLAKKRRFTECYSAQDVPLLERKRISWTQLDFTFSIRDRQARLALLEEAVREKWTDTRLRLTVQNRNASTRHGVGGRPRRSVESHEPEVALRELTTRCKTLLAYHAAAWPGITAQEWRQLVKGWPPDQSEQLEKLLTRLSLSSRDHHARPRDVGGNVSRRARMVKPESAAGFPRISLQPMLFNWLRSASRNAVLAGVSDAVRELGMPESNDPLAALRIHCSNLPALAAPTDSPPVESKGRKRAE